MNPRAAGPCRPGRRLAAWATAALLVVVGCGKKGPPLPPLGHRPETPEPISVVQRGDQVELSFVLPALYTDGKPITDGASVVLLRSAPGGRPEALRRFAPSEVGAAPGASVSLAIPSSELFDGLESERAVLYVEIDPVDGKPSRRGAPIPIPRAEPPPPPEGIVLEELREGIRIRWSEGPAAGPDLEYNVHRRRSAEEDWGGPRNLEPIDGREYVDSQVEFGTSYEYQVRAVIPGASPPRESLPAQAAPVRRTDRYSPDPPTAVRAVADPSGIRVFWFPPADADLGGFRVYRSTGEGTADVRAELSAEVPAFLDHDVIPGQSYEYRVTALDRADPPNESQPSEPAVEVAPPADPGEAP